MVDCPKCNADLANLKELYSKLHQRVEAEEIPYIEELDDYLKASERMFHAKDDASTT